MLDETKYAAVVDAAPIITLVITMLSVCFVVTLGRWVWTYVTAPPPPPTGHLPIVPVMIEPAESPTPDRYDFMFPTMHEHPMTRTATVVQKALYTVMGEPTAEWQIVWTEDGDEQLLAFDAGYAPDTETNLPVLPEDELGVWDPDEADWMEPAVYLEALEHQMRMHRITLPEATQRELGAEFRARTVLAIDAVLCGS